MESDPLWIAQGEAATYYATLYEANNQPSELTGVTNIVVRLKRKGTTEWAMELPCNQHGGGQVSFSMVGAETAAMALGRWDVQFRGDVAGGFKVWPKPGFDEAAVVRA